jgi:hypothetical protein
MPQNPNFNLESETVGSIFKNVGVLMADGAETFNNAILGAYYDRDEKSKGLYVVLPSSEIKYFDVDTAEVFPQNGGSIIRFDKDNVSYMLRNFIDEDGAWLSSLKVELPVDALQTRVLYESTPAIDKYLGMELGEQLPFFESVFAYFSEESTNIALLIYMSTAGSYSRENFEWKPIDLNEDFLDDLSAVQLDNDKVAALVSKFDSGRGILTVAEVEQASSMPSE